MLQISLLAPWICEILFRTGQERLKYGYEPPPDVPQKKTLYVVRRPAATLDNFR
jgi:hypothetical protein